MGVFDLIREYPLQTIAVFGMGKTLGLIGYYVYSHFTKKDSEKDFSKGNDKSYQLQINSLNEKVIELSSSLESQKKGYNSQKLSIVETYEEKIRTLIKGHKDEVGSLEQKVTLLRAAENLVVLSDLAKEAIIYEQENRKRVVSDRNVARKSFEIQMSKQFNGLTENSGVESVSLCTFSSEVDRCVKELYPDDCYDSSIALRLVSVISELEAVLEGVKRT